LMFRAFPPYLVRAFIDYEKRQARAGKRPSGPLMTESALARLEVVEIAKVRAVVR
jgi:eukaryotic-like serine/threonine-protein kinase